MKLPYVGLTVFMLALTGGASAATPDQVGTWVGSLKTKVRTGSATSSVKSEMQLEIAADDTTTITLDGVVAPGGGSYVAGEAVLIYVDTTPAPNAILTYAVAHFKGTKVKGATSGITIGGGSTLIDARSGKFSLKKQ